MVTPMGTDDRAASPGLVRIVLADDHEVVRNGLRMVLDAEPGFEVVAEAGDLAATRRYVRAHRPHVLVLDINMPEGSSLPAIPEFAVGFPIALAGVANAEFALSGQPLDLGLIGERAAAFLPLLVFCFVINGGPEEPGWRGYALPRSRSASRR